MFSLQFSQQLEGESLSTAFLHTQSGEALSLCKQMGCQLSQGVCSGIFEAFYTSATQSGRCLSRQQANQASEVCLQGFSRLKESLYPSLHRSRHCLKARFFQRFQLNPSEPFLPRIRLRGFRGKSGKTPVPLKSQ